MFFEPGDITHDATAKAALTWGNPVAPFIETIRSIVYGGALPSAATCLYVAVAATVALVGGIVLFGRMQRELAVVV